MTETIYHPGRASDLEERVNRAALQARLDVLTKAYEEARDGLAAIFDAISRGDQAELTFPDGRLIRITKAKNRGEKDSESGDGQG